MHLRTQSRLNKTQAPFHHFYSFFVTNKRNQIQFSHSLCSVDVCFFLKHFWIFSNRNFVFILGESNVYTLGNIGAHRIVSTKLPSVGSTREAMTATGNTTTRLLGTFQKVDYVFVVGVAGGVPHYTDYKKHVRLGDVVISYVDKQRALDNRWVNLSNNCLHVINKLFVPLNSRKTLFFSSYFLLLLWNKTHFHTRQWVYIGLATEILRNLYIFTISINRRKQIHIHIAKFGN